MTPNESEIEAKFRKARGNLSGVGMACFATIKEQDAAFKEAFERLAFAGEAYVAELEAKLATAEARGRERGLEEAEKAIRAEIFHVATQDQVDVLTAARDRYVAAIRRLTQKEEA